MSWSLATSWNHLICRNGFLAVVGGVPLFEVEQALLPGTVNTTGQMMFPNDTIIIAGRNGDLTAHHDLGIHHCGTVDVDGHIAGLPRVHLHNQRGALGKAGVDWGIGAARPSGDYDSWLRYPQTTCAR